MARTMWASSAKQGVRSYEYLTKQDLRDDSDFFVAVVGLLFAGYCPRF